MAARAATLTDVAKEAGVSLATASRALNGSERVVRAELHDRTLAAAARLGYTPNAQAQSMAKGSTDLVGLLVNDIADPYFSTIAAGLATAAEEHGLLVMLCSTGGRPERELELLAALRRQRGRAIVLAGSRINDRAHLRELAAHVEPFTAAGGRVAAISEPRLPVDTVVVDNRRGAQDLAARLAELGYRRPAVLTGPERLLVSRDRRDGFLTWWRRSASGEPVCAAEEFSRDGGSRAMHRVLDEHPDVDVVFAINDLMALGAMAACRERGVRVPQDVAVAGFDDISTLRDVTPGLTTVRLPLAEMGRMALDLVLGEDAEKARRRKVRGEVVLRESTPGR
ncbi:MULTISPECIES: LacI family DNA-binding transcriptional regulator [unclassified Saccharopolyspora]|uniref:LacI family DNA-binding transcriptional regulator n=1 Tax=unclassified Saccharopolyspora TaxID=2646250 RepID=UPI001CD7DE6A|nr:MULTISPECIES: LacI family DNA-binding transcriptional regulator [unclassified Saccharopolyspora]MCA1187533.1 LacI family transcriptional regulator [Saccharopolyspora sp. 6T]MCA1224873.1 LacI family transcriptional regulator [Saccharopolyspora sp. 6M]MCA1279782.1 LacI family transcriptional regulator [Saccharopolyspora sp. 7B]